MSAGRPDDAAQTVAMMAATFVAAGWSIGSAVAKSLEIISYIEAHHVTHGDGRRTCDHCGEPFAVGPGTGRRADSKFCCAEHQIKSNRLKASKAA